MVKVISGNEPYMVDYRTKQAVGKLEVPELNFHQFDSFDESAVSFLAAAPLMDERRVALVRISHLKEIDNQYYHSFASSDSDNLLVVQARDYDARTTLFRNLKETGILELCNKSDYVGLLSQFILNKASQYGVSFEDNVVEAMLRRCSYLDNEEMTIYVIAGYVESMAAISKTIDMPTMESVVPSYEKENRFALARMILDKNVKELRNQAVLLRGSEIECLSALLREYRIAYKSKYYSFKDIGITSAVLSRQDKDYLIRSITILTDVIRGIKKGTVCVSSCLQDTFLRLLQEV